MGDYATIAPPSHGLYRIARRQAGPFDPADWNYAGEDGTFGNRFDDPRSELPEDQRFRMIYCASDRRGAFGETLARFRPRFGLDSKLAAINDDELLERSFGGAVDPEDRSRGLVGADWRRQRVMGHTVLEPGLRFVDLTAVRTIQQLREELGSLLHALGLHDFDQSSIMGPSRPITQRIACHIYEQQGTNGGTLYAGVRYTSRLGQEWDCWGVFADRMKHKPAMPEPPQAIRSDDPDLLIVASLFSLTVETSSRERRL